jgi:hypothetical protein
VNAVPATPAPPPAAWEPSRLLAPALAGIAVFAYARAFGDYGIFDIPDEGVLLVQSFRVASGQVPYVDFETGYGPVYFLLQATLVLWNGIEGVRFGLALVHGLAAACCYALARRIVGSGLAVAAVALLVAWFLPVAPAKGAAFNVPYPSWYAGLAGAVLPFLLDPRAPHPRWDAFLAGMLAGLVFAMKPNSGALYLAGSAAAIVLGGGAGAAGPLGWATLVLAAVAVAAFAAPAASVPTYLALATPAIAMAALGGTRGAADRDSAPSLVALGAGFAAVAAALFAAPFMVLGPEAFAKEALLLGARVGEIYALGLPWPVGIATAGGLIGFFFPERRGVAPAVAVIAAAAAMVDGARGAAHPAAALRQGGETAALVVAPLAVWGALAALRRPGRPELVAPAAVATAGILQLFPRADFLHLLPLAPLLVPLALRLWRGLVARLPVGPALGRAVLVGVPLAVAAGRALPTGAIVADRLAGRLVPVDVGGTRLVVRAEGAGRLLALAEAAAVVHAGVRDDEPVATFPACGIVPFFARRLPAGEHDYFFPGRPSRGEAAVLALRLGDEYPRMGVTCDVSDTALAGAWEYYPEMVGLFLARYRPTLERPPFTVWVPDPKPRPVRRRGAARGSSREGPRGRRPA